MSDMTDERAADVLAAHNEWRRYDGETGEPGASVMGNPAEIGRALDHAVSRLRSQPPAEIEALRAEVSGLRAARIAYASEFPPTEDGDPDVGNIHANIRAMKSRAERLAEEIDWIKFQPEDDRMFAEIEAAAKASFHRHRTSCRGQVLTRADNYESHLVWATLEWAKRTNGVEQHAERLAEALREKADKWVRIGDEHGVRQFTGNDHKLFANELRALLRDHDQE